MELIIIITAYILTSAAILQKPSRHPHKKALKALLWPWFVLKAAASWLAEIAWRA